MDYRTDRFDQFGFETPFSPTGAAAFAQDYAGDAFDPAGEGEELAWLDTEGEAFDAELLQDEWEEAAPVASPQPLLGGRLWSGIDAQSGTRHAIFVTPAALAAERAEVLFYVHGLLRPCGGLPKAGVAAFISEAQFALGASVVGSGRPIVLIVPQFQEADDRKWSTRGLDKPAAFNAYVDRRLAEVGTATGRAAPQISGLIVAGHSRAYGILNPLAASHAAPAMAQGALARLTGLWFLDSSYGGFPTANAAALLKAKPGLNIRQVYIAGSRTDSLGGRSRQGRLAYLPVSARKARHCAIPAKCLPDLLADRPLSVAYKPVARREAFAEEQDFGGDGEDYAAFAFEDEQADWAEAEDEDFDGEDFDSEDENFDHDVWASEEEDEGGHRCSNNEVLFEGMEPFMEAEDWSSSPDQVAFRERVLAEHVKRTEKRKKQKAQPDLPDDQLATIPGTKIKTRKDTAVAAGRLLNAANAALAQAQGAGDADALRTRNITVTSGYRSASRQLNLWRGVFSAKGGYYDTTDAKRQTLPGGAHSEAAIAYLLKPTGSGGFGLGGRIAAPGFSNHQSGTALDFLVNLTKGGSIKLSSKDRYRAIWRASWFHKWMRANAAAFGFHPIPTEEWHWEYRPGTATQSEGLDFAFEGERVTMEEDEDFEFDELDDGEDESDGMFVLAEDFSPLFESAPLSSMLDLAPEPYSIHGGLYNRDQKKYHASHRSGLLRTASIVGRQERKLYDLSPGRILIGKELTRYENGKLGDWIEDYNAFTDYFEEVLRAIGRLRDLISAGAPEAPGDMTPFQKLSFKPTDDGARGGRIKPPYQAWRAEQEKYLKLVIDAAAIGREVGRRRKDFWQAQGELARAIGVAKRMSKPEFEAIDAKLSDVVSIATAGTLATGVVTGAAVLIDWIVEARKNREAYDRKLGLFIETVRDQKDAIKDRLEAMQNASARYWTDVTRYRTTIDERDLARKKSREAAGTFTQNLLERSEKRPSKYGSVRMPAQIAEAWRTLAIVGPRALKLQTSLKQRWGLVDDAAKRFRRLKSDPLGVDDITQVARAALRADSWREVLTKDDVEEWIAMSGLWEETYTKFFQ